MLRTIIIISIILLSIPVDAQQNTDFKIFNNKTTKWVGSDKKDYTIKHMSFLNISFSSTIEQFCTQLKKRGFSRSCDCEDSFMGKYEGREATITLETNEMLDLVYSVTVNFQCEDAASAETLFRKYIKKFTSLYEFDKLLTEIYMNGDMSDDEEHHDVSHRVFKQGKNTINLSCDYYTQSEMDIFPNVSVTFIDYLNQQKDIESRH